MSGLIPETVTANCREEKATALPTDLELLKRFRTGDEEAFSELVQRHAGLVISVCRRVLHQANDAEDAFQATFLVLAKKADSLEWNDSIAGWLHQTARRTALKLRSMSARRRRIEEQAARQHNEGARLPASSPANQAAIQELVEILDSELANLSSRFREVILLSQVEGLAREEVAERLGISVAAVKDRLERGREQLHSRLLRRGVTLTAVALAAWLIPEAAQAANVSSLCMATSQAAGPFAMGTLASGTSPTAFALAQGILKMMVLEKLKVMSVGLLSVLALCGIAFGVLRDEPARFDKGLRGNVVSVQPGNPSTVTVALSDSGTLLNLDVSTEAKVWTAYEPGQFADLTAGQLVSLRLGDDHRTVNEIHIQGRLREASIKSVSPTGKITIVDGDDEESEEKPVELDLAPDVILRIGGLPAARSDLQPGMQVPLEFGRDGKFVNAIEAEAKENSLVSGELRSVDPNGSQIHFALEGEEEGQTAQRSFAVTRDTFISLDGKPAMLADLKPGSAILLRLADDGFTARAIQATSPEPAEEPVQADEK